MGELVVGKGIVCEVLLGGGRRGGLGQGGIGSLEVFSTLGRSLLFELFAFLAVSMICVG